MLHSAFWHHGASDLSLPGWWAATSGGNEQRAAGNASSAASSSGGGVLLDFLYPEKTLALLRQLSVSRSDTSLSHRRHLPTPSVRRYSTLEVQQRSDEASVHVTASKQEKVKQVVASRDIQAFRKLQAFLRRRESSGQDYAWQLYQQHRSQNPSSTSSIKESEFRNIQADLLEYLAVDDDPAVPQQVLQLFADLPEEYRRVSSYRAAIAAYISSREVERAIQLLDSIPSGQDYNISRIGFDLVLRRTVLDEQWDLSLRVFGLFLSLNPNFGKVPASVSIQWGNRLPHIWQGVTTAHRLQDYLWSFLTHVREFREDLTATEKKAEALSLFTMTFVPQVMEQVLRDETRERVHVIRFFKRVFTDLDKLEIPLSVCYEHALKLLMDLEGDASVHDLATLRVRLYNEHRQLCLDSMEQSMATFRARPRIKPSLHLLRNLIIHYCDRGQVAKANEVLEDHHTFYPHAPLRAGLLEYLVHFYADHGDLAHCEEYVQQVKTHYSDHVTLKLLSALPFACSRRADIAGTIEQFNRIRDEFGLVQDTVCWNILLLAYSRSDDLDGALECFNTLMANEIKPDLVTFGTLLDLCAQRGDVEAFEALFSRAEQMGIDLQHDTRARSAYVQVFLRAGDAQGAEAIAQGMLKSWQNRTLSDHTLTHTWNLLIQQHALDGDIASARERYREMVDNNIPLDTWTYSSLMRALVEVKQSNAAYKLLRRTLPEVRVREHALHYAIVLTGLLREGGANLDLAMRAYERMQKLQISQTPSSQLAVLQVLGEKNLREANRGATQQTPHKELPKLKTRATHANYQLEDVHEAVENMVAAAAQGQAVYREPQHMRSADTRSMAAAPQAFYGQLISLYATRGAYKTCKKLMQKAERLAPREENYTTPLTLIIGSMEAHLKAKEFNEVRDLWLLAITSARKMTKTFAQVVNPEPPLPQSDDLLDPSIADRYQDAAISPNRRQILVRAARVYIRSLLDPANTSPIALTIAKQTMVELLQDGYAIGGVTWNELISTLAQRGRLTDAFSLCEKYLMPSFPGWRDLHPNYIRKEVQGFTWMELRHSEIKRDSILLRYKTLIVLAGEYRKVKKDERNGVGYVEEENKWMGGVLEDRAPMCVRAIHTMPRTNDRLQVEYFHNTY
jgi:pentatricopeptide repeat-containing protein PET309